MIDTKSGKPTVHFVRCVDPNNAGDMNCNPLSYFPGFLAEFTCIQHNLYNINYSLIRPLDWIILGGGGILDSGDSVNMSINYLLLYTGGRVISWGSGHNTHYDCPVVVPASLENFALLSVRDYEYSSHSGETERYLPDVTCMINALECNNTERIIRELGIVEHLSFPITEFVGYDKISNAFAIEQILEFIRESNAIITNTYHVVYWATLMNKKVILCNKFSTKFEYFKYPPTQYSGNLESDLARASRYSNALKECRNLNVKFYHEVIELIRKDRREPRGILAVFLKIFDKLNGKKCAIKGAGKSTERLLGLLEGYFAPVCICDKESVVGNYFKYDVIPDNELEKYDVNVVVIASYKWRDTMKKDIANMSQHYEIFDIFDELEKLGIALSADFYSHESCQVFFQKYSTATDVL